MSRQSPIAIVGMACRLPGAEDVPAFEAMLREGRNGITEIPPGRLSPADPGRPPAYAGLLSDVEGFDRAPFGISKTEAPLIDPLQRLFLEASWCALEDAGLSPARQAGAKTGVFAGVGPSEYALLQAGAGYPAKGNPYQNLGVSVGGVSGRVAYCLGLTGPAQSIDSACASGLVALGAAADSLMLGHCDMALAGAVNILLDQAVMDGLSAAGVLSRAGANRSFDISADGFLRGEGGCVFALRRLQDARQRGDRILAVISGWSQRQNGRTNGIMASSSSAQEQGLRQVMSNAGVAPAQVGYVEGHGSATRLGDKMELDAISRVFASAGKPHVGSVKANIGHLEAGSGAAGVAKAVVMLERAFMPAQPGFERFADPDLPLRVATETAPWEGADRNVLITALGFNGSCAHVLLSAASSPFSPPRAGPGVALISAASAPALRARVAALARMLYDTSAPLASVAASVSRSWDGLPFRVSFVAETAGELRTALQDWLAQADNSPKRVRDGRTAGLGDVQFDAQALAVAFPDLTPPEASGPTAFYRWATQLGLTLEPGGADVDLADLLDDPSDLRLSLLRAVARLWAAGVVIDTKRLCHGQQVALPSYPFQRERAWFDMVRKPGGDG